MRTYEAVDQISKAIIEDGLCKAIVLKGSIGRGDDDCFSDVDMYAIVKDEYTEDFLSKRIEYLRAYLPVVYEEHVNFVAEQIVAIFDDGLHFDLYTVTESTMPHGDKVKVVYDPENIFAEYVPEMRILSAEELATYFNDALYCFVEADSAYQRKNYPWAAHIMENSIAESAVLLRHLFDKDYAYLGLKKINEVIPKEQFTWLAEASANLNNKGFGIANRYIIKILEYALAGFPEEARSKCNLIFFDWVKRHLGITIFNETGSDVNVEVR